jgi:hypothetical protein
MKKEIIEAFVEEMNDSFNDWVEFNGCDGDEEQIEWIEGMRVEAIQKINEAKDLDEVYEVTNFTLKRMVVKNGKELSHTQVFSKV